MTKFRLSESKAKQAWTLPNVRNFDRRSKSRLLTLLVLLMTAATGTWAQTETYTVSMNDGAENPTTWKGKVGDATQFGNLPLEGVTEGQTVTLKYDGTREVKIITAKVEVIPVGAIKGKFTVNADGKQVYFAKGNLQATYYDADWSDGTPGTWTWALAENQWDCVGDNAANNAISGDGTVSENGKVDLFRWVGVNSTYFTTAPAIYGITNTFTLSYFGYVKSENLKSDWGTLIGDGWRTLTKDEWNYLLNTRTVNGGTGAGKCFTYGQTVNDTLGLVIYPDGYTGSAYAGSDWATFEAAGCVFLPAAGYLWQESQSPQSVNSCIYYWTATSCSSDENSAFRLTFDNNATSGSFNSTHRNRGNAVRLVYDVE